MFHCAGGAPTGSTLRMLRLPDVLRGFLENFFDAKRRAMRLVRPVADRVGAGWLVAPDTLLRSHRRLATPTVPKSEGEGNLPSTNQGATAQVAVATKSKSVSLSAVVTQRVVQLVSAVFALDSLMKALVVMVTPPPPRTFLPAGHET